MQVIDIFYDGRQKTTKDHAFTWHLCLNDHADMIQCKLDDKRENFGTRLIINVRGGSASGTISQGIADIMEKLVQAIKVPSGVRATLRITQGLKTSCLPYGVNQSGCDLPSQQREALIMIRDVVNAYSIEEINRVPTLIRDQIIEEIPQDVITELYGNKRDALGAFDRHLVGEGLVPREDLGQVIDAIVGRFSGDAKRQ